ncbi:centriole, cilia and spindle-associated protein [Pseudophryne corroboree]|uniref:centriole, cilia and spindle-associated protein n=1 Tax=Pseudophryne corroboree TaxID=495146 RepID=UPI003081C92F
MHCKNLRTEYMKRFKDPHWDAYRKCYEEMLKYRLARRLLEHAHNPWMWEGWEGSSNSSSGRSTPPIKPPEPAPAPHQAPEAAQAPHKLPHTDDDNRPDVQLADPVVPTSGSGPVTQETTSHSEKNTELDEKSVSRSRPQHSHRAASRKDGQKAAKSPQKTNLTKESRHAFALYACGERKKDTGSQKTHNVCAPTQENEIHESALRAKNRRQRDKKRQILQKQRARSADAESVRRRQPLAVDNPWMTEYMRCYSARTC